MRYEIRVNLNDESRSAEDTLTNVAMCAGEEWDSAEVNPEKVVTLEGRVFQPSRLARILLRIRLLNWGHVTIERTV